MNAPMVYPHQQKRLHAAYSTSEPTDSRTFHGSLAKHTTARRYLQCSPDISSVVRAAASTENLPASSPRSVKDAVDRKSGDDISVEAALLLMQGFGNDDEERMQRRSTPLTTEGHLAPQSSSPKRPQKKRRNVSVPSGKMEAPIVLPFIQQLSNIVSDPGCRHIISWSSDGKAILIHDIPEFELSILPKHFNHSNYWSFTRQISYYGFRKITTTLSKALSFTTPSIRVPTALASSHYNIQPDNAPSSSPPSRSTKSIPSASAFQHPNFIRGRADLLPTIQRTRTSTCEEVRGPSSDVAVISQHAVTSFELWSDKWTPVFGPCIASTSATQPKRITKTDPSPRDISPFTALYSDEADLFPPIPKSNDDDSYLASSSALKNETATEGADSDSSADFLEAQKAIQALRNVIEKLPAGNQGWSEIAKGLREIGADISAKDKNAKPKMESAAGKKPARKSERNAAATEEVPDRRNGEGMQETHEMLSN